MQPDGIALEAPEQVCQRAHRMAAVQGVGHAGKCRLSYSERIMQSDALGGSDVLPPDKARIGVIPAMPPGGGACKS